MKECHNHTVLFFIRVAMTAGLFWAISIASLYGLDKEAPSHEKNQINIQKNSRIHAEQITLGEVAEINASGLLKEALKKIDLGRAPRPGQIKALEKKKIIARIQSQPFLPENIRIYSPSRIYVKRASQTISETDVKRFVIKALDEQYASSDYELTSFEVQGLDVYPQGRLTFSSESTQMVDTKGRLSLNLTIWVDGEKADRVRVKGTVAKYTPVLFSVRKIYKGEFIRPEDVALEKKNIFELDKDYISDVKRLGKRIAKTTIKRGACLTRHHLTEPTIIKKGDIVTLVAKNENLTIVTSAICLEDGFENRLIMVENLHSGKKVQGVVKNKSRVEVAY
jgi:flagella basal body P-ring formation protein FlgA